MATCALHQLVRLACVLLFLATSVPAIFATEPARVALYDSASAKLGSEPNKHGWIAGNDRKLAVGQTTSRGWRIEDDDEDGAEDLYYRFELTDDQRHAARARGFTYRWRLRIPDDTKGITRAVSTEVCLVHNDGTGRVRMGLQIGRSGSELVTSIYAGSAGFVDGALNVANPDEFHEWEMLFDGKSSIVNVLIDGRLVLATKVDHVDTGHDLVFGSRSTGTGTSEWSRVEFSIGLPEVAQITQPPEPPASIDLFVGGQDDYFAYRIPSLIATPKGTLLAFCEGRKSSLADLGNNDLMLKRSTDGGKTWRPLELVHDGGDKVTIGNPTPVVDRDTGVIWMLFGRDARDVLVTKSEDDGRTWAEPVAITKQVTKPDWKFYGVGPGIAIQLRHGEHKGRLVVPAYHRTTADKSGPAIAHVFYSDDHGETWSVGADVGLHSCECQVVEILGPDGPEILLNARNHWARSGGRPDLAGKRIIARSRDGGETWSEPTFDDVLIEPQCQASIFRYSWADGDEPSRILFANPASRGRNRMTVRISYDEGRTWVSRRLIYGNSAAYCCLTRLPDGRVGLLYEADRYTRLVFTAFDLDWLTLGESR